MRYFSSSQKGITLLLVILLLSVLMTISIGIFNVIYGEILISGEIGNSYKAFYAADSAAEKFLYLDRLAVPLADGVIEDTTLTPSPTGCHIVAIYKNPAAGGSIETQCGLNPGTANVCIKSIGQFACGIDPTPLIKRGFMLTY